MMRHESAQMHEPFFARNGGNLGVFDGARDRNRTSDTRIFNPHLSGEKQEVDDGIPVKPGPADQDLSDDLSNYLMRVQVAAEWLSVQRSDLPAALIGYAMARCGLSRTEARVAIDRARVLRNARAL